MKRASESNQVLIIIPAFNEEAAIGKVIYDVKETMPSAPVLVIDDA